MKRVFLAVVAILGLAACGAVDQHNEERGRGDAGVGVVDDSEKEVIQMPDRFSNVAHACDGHGHRVYVTTKSDQSRFMAVIDDPECGPGEHVTWTAKFVGGPLHGAVRDVAGNPYPPLVYEAVEERPLEFQLERGVDAYDYRRVQYRLERPSYPLFPRRQCIYRCDRPPPPQLADTFAGRIAELNLQVGELFDAIRRPFVQAAARWAEAFGEGMDSWSHEKIADMCWRCDAVPAETDVGLCGDCRADLTGEHPS